MAAAIEKNLGVKAELVVGSAGEYSVWRDGQKVVDKTAQRFPDDAEVIAALTAHQ